MQQNNLNIEQIVKLIACIPSIGSKSSKRILVHLLKNRTLMKDIAKSLTIASNSMCLCNICFNIDISNPCHICMDEKRDKQIICVVEDLLDLWAFKKIPSYNGVYHVLGGRLSSIDDVGPDNLHLHVLLQRCIKDKVKEVIIATNFTIEGRTTAFYIADMLKENDIKVSLLAHGIPIGGELDYMDEGTLEFALSGRNIY